MATNERDKLGDNLVPDYITHVKEDGFYGWPWYYMGGHQDPRHAGKHPELKAKVKVPDVLFSRTTRRCGSSSTKANSSPPTIATLFAAAHGSWNKGTRTGYKSFACR